MMDDPYVPGPADLRGWLEECLRLSPAEEVGVGADACDCPIARLISRRTGEEASVRRVRLPDGALRWSWATDARLRKSLHPLLARFAEVVDGRWTRRAVLPGAALRVLDDLEGADGGSGGDDGR